MVILISQKCIQQFDYDLANTASGFNVQPPSNVTSETSVDVKPSASNSNETWPTVFQPSTFSDTANLRTLYVALSSQDGVSTSRRWTLYFLDWRRHPIHTAQPLGSKL